MQSWKTVAIVLGVLALLSVGGSVVYGARMRGVAQAHIELARQDSILKDSLTVVATGLRELAVSRQAALVDLVTAAQLQRIRDSVEVAGLRADQDEARERTLEAIEDLPPEVMTIVQPVIVGFERQVMSLERQVTSLRRQVAQGEERLIEAVLTSTTWMDSSLGYERALGTSNAENANLRAAVEALEGAITPSFGLKLKLGWWMAPTGLLVGYVLGGGF